MNYNAVIQVVSLYQKKGNIIARTQLKKKLSFGILMHLFFFLLQHEKMVSRKVRISKGDTDKEARFPLNLLKISGNAFHVMT